MNLDSNTQRATNEVLSKLDNVTIVVIQSVSLGTLTRKYLLGLDYFEERNLYLLFKLANPNIRLIFLMTGEVSEAFLHYSLEKVAFSLGCTIINLKDRITMINLPPSTMGLSESILKSSKVQADIIDLVKGSLGFLSVWCAGINELRLSNILNMPIIGPNERSMIFDSKSIGRGLVSKTNVPMPRGWNDVVSIDQAQELISSMSNLITTKKYILKLNNEDGGNGIAYLFCGHKSTKIESISVEKMISFSEFKQQLSIQGAVLEEFLKADEVTSPSIKLHISNDGSIDILATHEQITNGGMYLGARFQANNDYRNQLVSHGLEIAKVCKEKGIRGIFSVDFLACRSVHSESWELYFLELNLRSTATTHAYYWTKYLTNSSYNSDTGTLESSNGLVFYSSCEYFHNKKLNTFSVAEIIDMLKKNNLDFSHNLGKGVVLHMVGTIADYSKFGATIIGQTPEEVENITHELNTIISYHCNSSV